MTTRPLAALSAAITVMLFAVGARATTSCSFGTIVGVAFGGYDVFDALPLDSAGSISFSCQNVGALDTIVIDLSRGSAPGFLPRQMTHGTDVLSYNLFLDASRTTVWGDGTGGTSQYGPSTPPSGTTVTVPVYGRVPAQQNAAVGSYGDTVVVTILY